MAHLLSRSTSNAKLETSLSSALTHINQGFSGKWISQVQDACLEHVGPALGVLVWEFWTCSTLWPWVSCLTFPCQGCNGSTVGRGFSKIIWKSQLPTIVGWPLENLGDALLLYKWKACQWHHMLPVTSVTHAVTAHLVRTGYDLQEQAQASLLQ